MRARKYAILMACLLAVCVPGSAGATVDDSPLALIQRCLAQLQDAKHKAIASHRIILSNTCPQLSLSLDNPQLAQLEPPLQDITSVRQLIDVRRSLQSRQPNAVMARAPRINGVKQILKQVYQPHDQTRPKQNFLEKVMDWVGHKIQGFLKRHHWFADNFQIDKKTGTRLLYGILSTILVLLVALVLFIIVNELRVAGVVKLLGRRRHSATAPSDSVPAASTSSAMGMQAISKLPPNHQVPELLRYTLQFLIDRKILPRRYNLTNHEFLGLLRESAPAAGNDFEQLINGSERVIYGRQSLAIDDTQRLFDHVKNMEQLPAKDNP